MNDLTLSLLRHAHVLAREINAKALMFDAEAWQDALEIPKALEELCYRVILLTRTNRTPMAQPIPDYITPIKVPDVPMTRMAQIKIGMLVGVAEKALVKGDVVVCLSGAQSSNQLDLMVVLRVGSEPEFFVTNETSPLPPDVDPAVFERVLTIASELAVEGREKRQIGTLLVIGDSDHVLENSRQLIFNPFHGYPEEDRNVLSGLLDETIKEFSAIDGAFVIRGDGVVLAAGRYLVPTGKPAEPLRSGLGARHEAAAAITAVTDAVAIVLSESTSTISVFNSGRLMMEIEKRPI